MVRALYTLGLALPVCAFMLFGLRQFIIYDEPFTELKRTIIVAFAASFFATALDGCANADNNK